MREGCEKNHFRSKYTRKQCRGFGKLENKQRSGPKNNLMVREREGRRGANMEKERRLDMIHAVCIRENSTLNMNMHK